MANEIAMAAALLLCRRRAAVLGAVLGGLAGWLLRSTPDRASVAMGILAGATALYHLAGGIARRRYRIGE